MASHSLGPLIAAVTLGVFLGAMLAWNRESAGSALRTSVSSRLPSIKAWMGPHPPATFVTYTVTTMTADGTGGQIDVQLSGTNEKGERVDSGWHTLREAGVGFAVSTTDPDTFEIMDAVIAEVDTLRVKPYSTDAWRPDWVRVAVGCYPSWKEVHFENTACVSTKSNCPTREYSASVPYHVILKVRDEAGSGSDPVEVRFCGADTSKCSEYFPVANALADGATLSFTRYWKPLSHADVGGALKNVYVRNSASHTCAGGVCPNLEWVDVRVGKDEPGQKIYLVHPNDGVCQSTTSSGCRVQGFVERVKATEEEDIDNLQSQITALVRRVDELQHVEPVLVNDGRVKYTIQLVTSTETYGGTSASISLGLVGTAAETSMRVITTAPEVGSSKTYEIVDRFIGDLKSLKVSVSNGDCWRPVLIKVSVGTYPSWAEHYFQPWDCFKDASGVVEKAVGTRYEVSLTNRGDASLSSNQWQARFKGESGTWTPWINMGSSFVDGQPVTAVFYSNVDFGASFVSSQFRHELDVNPAGLTPSEVQIAVGSVKYRWVVPTAFFPDGCTTAACEIKDGRGPSNAKVKLSLVPIKTIQDLERDNEDVLAKMQSNRGVIGALSRAAINMQFGTEQRAQSQGGSGVVRVRGYVDGSDSFYDASFGGGSVLSIHEHANNIRTVGMGEFSAVMNGVYFQTRHNDYSLKSPSVDSTDYKATTDIPFPEVPPSVKNAGGVTAQVAEMREYFRAWRDQDPSHRDYRGYFPACLCYLEVWWAKHTADEIDEPFASDRHLVEAQGWDDLYGKIMFLFNNGRKNNNENLPFLPSVVKQVSEDNTPIFADLNYRILCHKLKDDLPTHVFNLEEDFHVLKRKSKPDFDALKDSRMARFSLNADRSTTRVYGRGDHQLLDELMEEIPGLNNYNADLTDPSFDATLRHAKTGAQLNVGYYSRYYSAEPDAMGRSSRRRGYNDPNLWAARTTHPEVMSLKANEESSKGKPARYVEQAWSWALPLEIVYLTPLSSWNPYNLPYRGKAGTAEGDVVTDGGRNGGTTQATAYKGMNSKVYYQTPVEFFSDATGGDAADTAKGSAGVLDNGNNVRLVRPSGTRIMLPDIPDVGQLRQRWPICPVHEEGSTQWKEIKAIQNHILDSTQLKGIVESSTPPPPPAGHNFMLTEGGTTHEHDLYLPQSKVDALKAGTLVTGLKADLANGHEHTLKMQKKTGGSCPSDMPTTYSSQSFDSSSDYCWGITDPYEPHGLKCVDCA